MSDIKQIQVGNTTYDIKDDDASTVSVSASGTATDEVSYITIDGVEKKIGGGGSSGAAWGSITGTLSNQTDLNTALNGKRPAKIVKSIMDAVCVPDAEYYLGTQSSVAISMPTDAIVGQEILVCFTSGATACTLTCDLEGFDFVPKANKTSWLKFSLYHKADVSVAGDNDSWLVETKEG